MKIKQFTGRDMRDALRQVRATLGADAIILTTRSCAGGVEVSAAVDAEHLRHASSEQIRELVPDAPLASGVVEMLASPPASPAERPAAAVAFEPPSLARVPPTAPSRLPARAAAEPASDPSGEQHAMSEELRILRQLLERQLAALAWNDFTRREPMRARALTDLTELGLGRDVALSILEEFPTTLSAEQAQRFHYGLLAKRIATCGSPADDGGVLALIGAAGSGRTSMIAKLGQRWLREHSKDSLVVVTIDGGHLGAAEQARSLGRMLGVASYRFADAAAFADGARCTDGHDLVLIDTPPLTGEESEATALAAGIARACPDFTSMLLLPASTQAGALDEMAHRASAFAPLCCAVTRCDEAVSLGGLMSTLVRTRLPVAFLSDGPRIAEDLRLARSHQLVARAAELARDARAHADEDLLARRFGGQIHAAA